MSFIAAVLWDALMEAARLRGPDLAERYDAIAAELQVRLWEQFPLVSWRVSRWIDAGEDAKLLHVRVICTARVNDEPFACNSVFTLEQLRYAEDMPKMIAHSMAHKLAAAMLEWSPIPS